LPLPFVNVNPFASDSLPVPVDGIGAGPDDLSGLFHGAGTPVPYVSFSGPRWSTVGWDRRVTRDSTAPCKRRKFNQKNTHKKGEEGRGGKSLRTESASLANSGIREVWWLASGAILSCVPIGRGAAPGKFNFLSFSSSFSFLSSEEEEMGMAYDGPTGATVGELGAVVAYKLSAGSQCGFFWA